MTDSFTFRDMAFADVAEVASIEALSTASPWSEDSFRIELRNAAARCRVALCDGRIAGFLVAWRVLDETQVAELGVHPDFRRRGLGRLLVSEAMEEARSRGSSAERLEVREGNAAARRLYESMGFVSVGRRPKYYEGREDAILMDKKI